MYMTCTFIDIIVVVPVVSLFVLILILFPLFRHFYSRTALRELHKEIGKFWLPNKLPST